MRRAKASMTSCGGTADKLKKSFERYDEAAKAVGEEVSEGTSDQFAA